MTAFNDLPVLIQNLASFWALLLCLCCIGETIILFRQRRRLLTAAACLCFLGEYFTLLVCSEGTELRLHGQVNPFAVKRSGLASLSTAGAESSIICLFLLISPFCMSLYHSDGYCLTIFTFSAVFSHLIILAAYSGSVVSITRQPLVLAIRRVRSHLPLYIQSSITIPTLSPFTNNWYLSIASYVIGSSQYAFFPHYETVAGIGIEATLAVGSETDHPHLYTGTVAEPDGWFP